MNAYTTGASTASRNRLVLKSSMNIPISNRNLTPNIDYSDMSPTTSIKRLKPEPKLAWVSQERKASTTSARGEESPPLSREKKTSLTLNTVE